jgi:hypothetical protein
MEPELEFVLLPLETTMDPPFPVPVASPALTTTSPPLPSVDVVSPATMRIEPPDPELPSPTTRLMDPA